MAKTIKEIAQEKASFIPANVYGFNMTFLRSEVAKACEDTANDVLTKVEEILYRKRGGKIPALQILISELKGE